MFSKKWNKTFISLALTTCILTATTNAFASNPNDPYEPFNRSMFKINEFLDRYILKPVATVYNKIMPKPLAKGISNVYNNIDMVPTTLNDVLQGNFYQAASDAWRLGINTTIGIGGLFDVAQHMGLPPNYEDFGLTLARWGYVRSNYLVLPFWGPGTVRDVLGYPVNYYALSIYPYIKPVKYRYRIYLFGVLVRRADMLHYDSVMQQLAFDKYVFQRDAYLQHRNYLIERNKHLGNPYFERNRLQENADAEEQEAEAVRDTQAFATT